MNAVNTPAIFLFAGSRSAAFEATNGPAMNRAVPSSAADRCRGRSRAIRLESMIRIRFTDLDAKKRALGRLAGRFPFKSWATGEMLVPEAALGFLATENIPFQVEGPATSEVS